MMVILPKVRDSNGLVTCNVNSEELIITPPLIIVISKLKNKLLMTELDQLFP